jgi:hypothetical protein
MKRKVRPRRGKEPPCAAVAAQPETLFRLHGIEINFNQTTVADYAEHFAFATFRRLLHLTRPSSLAPVQS